MSSPARLCASLLLALASAPILAQDVTEFSVFPPDTWIDSMLSYRGRLWFLSSSFSLSQVGPPQVTVLKTDGSIEGQFLLPNVASELAIGPDANIWFNDGGRIGKSDLTGSVFARYPTVNASQPTAGPDGAIWFSYLASSSPSFAIGRLAPDGAITEFPLPGPLNQTGPFLTLGSDGAWWLLENSEFSGQIARWTPGGDVTSFSLETDPCSYFPGSLAAGPDGAAWFTENPAGNPFGVPDPCQTQPGKVVRIAPDGSMIEYPLDPNAAGHPGGILAGPDGALWVSLYGSYEAPNPGLGRITAGGDITVFPLSGLVDSVGGMAFGPDGAIWFNNGSADGKIYRFAIPAGVSCVADQNTLCLDHGRFRVQASWVDATAGTGVASVVDGGVSEDSGLLWFFSPDNWELLIKVLDACNVNGEFWVYGAASTDVQYTVQVTDTKSGLVWTYTNPLGTRSAAITDSAAFSSCP